MKKKIIYPTKLQRSWTLVVLLFLFSLQTFSQAPDWLWAKGMGGTNADIAYSVATDASGNVYTAGTFWDTADFDPGPGVFTLTSVGLHDIFISKSDASGNFIWAKRMGGTSGEQVKSIAIDISGNIYSAGAFQATSDFDPGTQVFNLTSAGDWDIFISKLDNFGNFVWAKAMGGINNDAGFSIAISAAGSGDVYTTGSFHGTADFDPGPGVFNISLANTASWGGYADIFVSKLNSAGNFIWAKAMGGATDDEGYAIAIDSAGAGDVYTTGYFSGTADFDPGIGVFNLISDGAADIFISKLDASGNYVWARRMGGTGYEFSYSMAVDNAGGGGIYTTGVFEFTADFDPGPGTYNLTSAGSYDIFISKLDGSGSFVWAKAFNGSSADFGNALTLDASGNVYTTGYFDGTADFDPGTGIFNLASVGSYDLFISKLDSSGNFVWAKRAGGAEQEHSRSIALSDNGNVHIAGSFFSATSYFGSITLTNAAILYIADIFIAKLDTLSMPTGNNEAVNVGDGINLFPNPASDELIVRSWEFGEIKEIEIYDVMGEKRLTPTLPRNTGQVSKGEGVRIDVSSLAAGIYFITVTDGEGKKAMRKFVKM